MMKVIDERPARPQAPAKPKAAAADLLRIAEKRTPHCRFACWAVLRDRRCVVTLGSEDLRIFVADHKPPTVFPLARLTVRRGRRQLELRRRGWAAELLARRVCCCEFGALVVTMRMDQVDDLCGILFPEPSELLRSRVPLAIFPSEVLHLIAESLVLPTIHELMRCSGKLREILTADNFWQHFYIKLFPQQVREQVEEFPDIDGCTVLDKVAIASLRFCNVCYTRRANPGFCVCGAKIRFNKFVHFDMRAAEKLRLGLHRLSTHFQIKGFDLQSACLCFSSRYHGNSLASMLRQTAAVGRTHLLVCESFAGDVFGALLSFPLQRRSSRLYGSCNRVFLFHLSPDKPFRIFEPEGRFPVVRSLPDALAIGGASEVALSLNWDLSIAGCEPSVLCQGATLAAASKVPLRSVLTFADASEGEDRRVSHLTADWGSHPEVQRNLARQLLQLSGQQDLR
ncbi:unnamed protein product, partial [Effrenium voratum]